MSQEQFAKAVIKTKLRIEDPEAYEKLVDIIYKFSMILLYGDNALRRQAVEAVFSILPEDLVLQILSDYISKTMARYRKLSELAAALVPRAAAGRGAEDMFIQIALEMFKAQMAGQQQPAPQPQTPAVAKVPEELKKLLE
jgi:hypothetical protein